MTLSCTNCGLPTYLFSSGTQDPFLHWNSSTWGSSNLPNRHQLDKDVKKVPGRNFRALLGIVASLGINEQFWKPLNTLILSTLWYFLTVLVLLGTFGHFEQFWAVLNTLGTFGNFEYLELLLKLTKGAQKCQNWPEVPKSVKTDLKYTKVSKLLKIWFPLDYQSRNSSLTFFSLQQHI